MLSSATYRCLCIFTTDPPSRGTKTYWLTFARTVRACCDESAVASAAASLPDPAGTEARMAVSSSPASCS